MGLGRVLQTIFLSGILLATTSMDVFAGTSSSEARDFDSQEVLQELETIKGLVCQKIGSGSYGLVFKCIKNNRQIALKVSSIYSDSGQLMAQNIRERFILEMNRDSQHLMYSTLSWASNRYLYVAMPFCETDLHQKMIEDRLPKMVIQEVPSWSVFADKKKTGFVQSSRFKHDQFKIDVQGLVSGLRELHGAGFIHRDLKPQNVLFCGGVVKIADFGAAREWRDSDQSNFSQNSSFEEHPWMTPGDDRFTLWISPPEILLGNRVYGLEADLWSLGTVVAFMGLGYYPFSGGNEYDYLLGIFHVFGTPVLKKGVQIPFPKWPQRNWLDTYPSFQDPWVDQLVQSLLQMNPVKRNQDQVMESIELSQKSQDFIQRVQARKNSRQQHVPSGLGDRALKRVRMDYILHQFGRRISHPVFLLAQKMMEQYLAHQNQMDYHQLRQVAIGILGIATALDGNSIELTEMLRLASQGRSPVREEQMKQVIARLLSSSNLAPY